MYYLNVLLGLLLIWITLTILINAFLGRAFRVFGVSGAQFIGYKYIYSSDHSHQIL